MELKLQKDVRKDENINADAGTDIDTESNVDVPEKVVSQKHGFFILTDTGEFVHKTIALSGSMRFWDTFIEVAHNLSEKGYIVLTPFADRHPERITDEIAEMYDSQHRQRIDMADALYVINQDGYIGKSTQSEIDYARSKGKEIIYLHEPTHAKVIAVAGSDCFAEYINTVVHKLRLDGHIVFTPLTFGLSSGDLDLMLENYSGPVELYHRLNSIRNQQIEMSDVLYVVNVNYVVDIDTKREIEYAIMHGVDVKYYVE